jgi:hypothetical protein
MSRDVNPENIPSPSPAQAVLLADLAEERKRLESLALRASRLGHVRQATDEAAVLRFIQRTIEQAFHCLERVDRLGGRLVYRGSFDDGPRLDWIGPTAQVIEIKPYLERRHAAALRRM